MYVNFLLPYFYSFSMDKKTTQSIVSQKARIYVKTKKKKKNNETTGKPRGLGQQSLVPCLVTSILKRAVRHFRSSRHQRQQALLWLCCSTIQCCTTCPAVARAAKEGKKNQGGMAKGESLLSHTQNFGALPTVICKFLKIFFLEKIIFRNVSSLAYLQNKTLDLVVVTLVQNLQRNMCAFLYIYLYVSVSWLP